MDRGISPIFYEVETLNMVRRLCILGSGSLGHCVLDLWPQLYNKYVRSISPILFGMGIQNLMCG